MPLTPDVFTHAHRRCDLAGEGRWGMGLSLPAHRVPEPSRCLDGGADDDLCGPAVPTVAQRVPLGVGASIPLTKPDAQRSDYRRRFPDMRRLVLTEHAQVVGRLYLAHTEGELHILGIALRPDACGRDLGIALLQAVRARAAAHGLAVGL